MSEDTDESIPPLPDLEITERTRQFCDQQTIDRALQTIYERRPELFKKMAKREGTHSGPNDEFTREFDRFAENGVRVDLSPGFASFEAAELQNNRL